MLDPQEVAGSIPARPTTPPGPRSRAEYELLLHASTDVELAAEARAWENRLVGALAEALEHGGTTRPVNAARTLFNLARGYELESMLDPTLGISAFRERLDVVLTAIMDRENPQ